MGTLNPVSSARYARNALAKTPLMTQTIGRMLAEDPVLFSVQFSRRLPKKLRSAVAKLALERGRPSATQAFLAFISDHPEAARAALESLECQGKTPGKVTGELRVQLAMPSPDAGPSATRARDAWASGDLSGALSAADGSLHRRFMGEARVHSPRFLIRVPDASLSEYARPNGGEGEGDVRVFHFLTNSLPWTRSGYTFRSQAILEAQRKAGIEVRAATRLAYPTLIGRPWADEVDVVNGIVYERLEPQYLPLAVDQRLALQAKMLARAAAEFAPDVLQTTTNFHNALTVEAVARALGKPWVYEMRGNMEQSWIARQPANRRDELLESPRYLMMRARETQMARRADHVIVLSQLQAADMVARGVNPEKISVVPNSVDAKLLEVPRDPEAARDRLDLPQGFWVGTVTAVVDYEGLPVLLESVARLRERGLPAFCAIVGDGVALPGLIKQAEDLGISEYVRFPGRLPQADAQRWYEALDVFVIPRRDTEVTRSVTPIKGLQAMALGVPLVVSDLPALREVNAMDGQGLAVPPEDAAALSVALGALYRSPNTLNEMSVAGRKAAATKTWDAAAKTYREVYEGLLRKSTRPRQ